MRKHDAYMVYRVGAPLSIPSISEQSLLKAFVLTRDFFFFIFSPHPPFDSENRQALSLRSTEEEVQEIRSKPAVSSLRGKAR